MASGQQLYNLDPLLPFIEGDFTLITPNFRLARRIKSQWDRLQQARGARSWPRLDVYPLDHWLLQQWQHYRRIGQLPPLTLLQDLQSRYLWRQVIEERPEGEALSLLRPTAAAELASSARDTLIRWRVDRARLSAAIYPDDRDCHSFLAWLEEFERRLAKGSHCTGADTQSALLQVSPVAQSRLVLVDFDDITPLARSCLDHLASDWRQCSSVAGVAPHRAVAFADHADELAAVARWAASSVREQPESSVGIVLVDMEGDRQPLEYLLRREFDCLGERYTSLPVNFTTGISLDRAPVVRDALAMLELAGDSIPLPTLESLLNTRFSRLLDRQSAASDALLRLLRDQGLRQVDPGRLRFLTNREDEEGRPLLQLGAVLESVSALRLRRKRQLPSEWLAVIREILDCWGWPGPGPLDSLEYQQLEQWYSTLEQFCGLDQVAGQLDLQGMLRSLRRACQGQVSQPKTEDSNIQVLGPLEAAGLRFDHLWLCGLQASRWPAPARANPFIPPSLQADLAMPHATPQREWIYVEGLMSQYLGTAGEAVASFCRDIDGAPELPSALIADWPRTEGAPREELPDYWLAARGGLELTGMEDSRAPAVGELERSELRGGSATLEDQSNCPFRAFARRRLRLQPLGDYRVALTAAERGTLLHDALYILWGELGDSEQLAALNDSSLATLADSSARSAVESVPAGLRELVGLASLDLERQRLAATLLEWLAIERQRGPFRVVAREEAQLLEIAGLQLRLRIDRIDEVEGGGRLLIDYKSSSPRIADWLGARPAAPQLPLYASASDEVDAIAFADLRPRRQAFAGLGQLADIPGVKVDLEKALKNYSEAQAWPALLQEWRTTLKGLAQDFLAGAAEVDPLPQACTYCGLQPLCRIDMEGGR